jgi:hypothetical protein
MRLAHRSAESKDPYFSRKARRIVDYRDYH